MIEEIRSFFNKKHNKITVNGEAPSIPQGFNYPEEQFSVLIKDLIEHVDEDNRLSTFKEYIHSPQFKRHQLKLDNPQHTVILGYAFCASVILKENINSQTRINHTIRSFHPDTLKEDGKEVN